MLLKLIIYGLLIYWGAKIFKSIINPIPPKQNEVHGKPRTDKPLDLSNLDVEDADFEEIDE